MLTVWSIVAVHKAGVWEGSILGMITLCAGLIWGGINNFLKKQETVHKFFWELHVKLIQLSYAITVGQNHTLDFKMRFGELIHLCGSAPFRDPNFVNLLATFQNGELCLYPTFNIQTHIQDNRENVFVALNYPRDDEPVWRNFKIAFEAFSAYIAKRIYAEPHEFPLYSSERSYLRTHRLALETYQECQRWCQTRNAQTVVAPVANA